MHLPPSPVVLMPPSLVNMLSQDQHLRKSSAWSMHLFQQMSTLMSVVVQAACTTATALQLLDSSRFTDISSECASRTPTPSYTPSSGPVVGAHAAAPQLPPARPVVNQIPTPPSISTVALPQQQLPTTLTIRVTS
ncbi:hypothetical protein F4604DRAFT_1929904 [Suillus subluteus]|nr:hypothetical protein F4604DRAFT_1929904 [Suillus subluteus]